MSHCAGTLQPAWPFFTWNMELLYDPEISCQGLHPRETKTHNHTKTCAQMLNQAVETTRFQTYSTDWGPDELHLVHAHGGIGLVVVGRDEGRIHATTWAGLGAGFRWPTRLQERIFISQLWADHTIPKGIAGKHCCNGNKNHDNESQYLLNAHFRLSVA